MDLLLQVIIYVGVGVLWIFITSLFKHKDLKAKVDLVKNIADDVIHEVETIAKKEGIKGESKKELAINLINQALKGMGVKIPDVVIRSVVESAVFWMNYDLKNLEEGDE